MRCWRESGRARGRVEDVTRARSEPRRYVVAIYDYLVRGTYHTRLWCPSRVERHHEKETRVCRFWDYSSRDDGDGEAAPL